MCGLFFRKVPKNKFRVTFLRSRFFVPNEYSSSLDYISRMMSLFQSRPKKAKTGRKYAYPKFQEIIAFRPWNYVPFSRITLAALKGMSKFFIPFF